MIRKHVEADETDLERLEGIGALNFLALDDVMVGEMGEAVDPASVVALPTDNGETRFPDYEPHEDDPFVRRIEASGRKWSIITDEAGTPLLALDADAFIRSVFMSDRPVDPRRFCHRPIVLADRTMLLGEVLRRLRVHPGHDDDDVIDHDLLLVWTRQRRIITGADILGRLLRGIVHRVPAVPAPA